MPAEWEPHEAVWFSWPHPHTDSFPGAYERIPSAMARLVRAAAEFEPRELAAHEIPGVIAEYVAAARNARAAGIDGVETDPYQLSQATARMIGEGLFMREVKAGCKTILDKIKGS